MKDDRHGYDQPGRCAALGWRTTLLDFGLATLVEHPLLLMTALPEMRRQRALGVSEPKQPQEAAADASDEVPDG